jgi:hypothetical protein
LASASASASASDLKSAAESREGGSGSGRASALPGDAVLEDVLRRHGLEQVSHVFEEQEIDLESFLTLSRSDMTDDLGIVDGDILTRLCTLVGQMNLEMAAAAAAAQKRSKVKTADRSSAKLVGSPKSSRERRLGNHLPFIPTLQKRPSTSASTSASASAST